MAFNARNLAAVARALRQAYPRARLIVCADDDLATPGNPGLTLASATAREIGALIAVSTFGAGRVAGDTDFNDLHRAQGQDAVRAALDAATLPVDEDLDRRRHLRRRLASVGERSSASALARHKKMRSRDRDIRSQEVRAPRRDQTQTTTVTGFHQGRIVVGSARARSAVAATGPASALSCFAIWPC